MKESFNKYGNQFSLSEFWNKIQHYAKQAGVKVVYSVLLLFYAYKRKDTPYWAKHIITGTICYFLAPFDAIPDLTPILGYTDDLGILSFGLVTVAGYINGEVREQARERLGKWFGEYDPKDLEKVEEIL